MRKKSVLNHSGSADPIFAASIEKVIAEIDLCTDDNCLELNRDLEKRYLLNHMESVWWNVNMIKKGIKIMSHREKPALLDIGTSPLTFAYRCYFPNAGLFTVDLTSLLADRCRKAGIDHRVCDLLKEPLPLDNRQVDIVVFTEVLEHLNIGPGRIFAEINRVLNPGGMLIFSIPNISRLNNRIKFALGKPVLDPVYRVYKEEKLEQSQGDGVWVHGFGHIREYTMSEALDMVQRYGFEVLMKRSVDSYLSPPPGCSSKLRRTSGSIYRIASSIIPNSRMINLILARKR